MEKTRQKIYEDLEAQIGNTKLESYEGNVPNGNQILIKRECDNPFGSHYDRVYLSLYKHYEETGKIQPGQKVIETSSGSAGVSFAGIGKLLGYDCYVALPAGGEKAREKALVEQLPNQDHLILTEKEDYVNGFPRFIKRFIVKNRDFFFLNHSMGPNNTNNEVALKPLEDIITEVKQEIGKIDYFVPAVGNGTSILGPSRALSGETKVVGFETVQSATAYEMLHPGKYQEQYKIAPGTMPRHELPGTSFKGIDFPHLKNAILEGKLDEVVLISSKKMDEQYAALTGSNETAKLPHYDSISYKDLGRTGRAGLAVALDLAKNVQNKKIVVIAYDKASRYDSQ